MDTAQDLQGLRVLVVEDEAFVSMLIEEMCTDLGCTVIGPAATLKHALECSQRSDFDVALVDMNLGGVKADAVMAELHSRSIPFAIASGGSDDCGGVYAAPILSKPFGFAEFAERLSLLAASLPAKRST